MCAFLQHILENLRVQVIGCNKVDCVESHWIERWFIKFRYTFVLKWYRENTSILFYHAFQSIYLRQNSDMHSKRYLRFIEQVNIISSWPCRIWYQILLSIYKSCSKEKGQHVMQIWLYTVHPLVFNCLPKCGAKFETR